MAVNGRWRAYGKYAWTILLVSALLGIFGGVSLVFPSDSTSLSPRDLWVLRAWGITWVGFNILVLALSVGPYRRGERWAWYALWLVPLLFIGYFVIAPETIYFYLVLAALVALGLILPYRRYLFGAEQRPSRVSSSPEDPFPPGRVAESREITMHPPEDLQQLALDDPHAWLITSARYFQTLGFYTLYLDLPDDALLDAISEAVRWNWDGPLPPEEVARDLQLADMVLLLGDRSRVWWRDLEGVFAGEDAYVTTLTEWATISRGAFAPEEIVERWHSEDRLAAVLLQELALYLNGIALPLLSRTDAEVQGYLLRGFAGAVAVSARHGYSFGVSVEARRRVRPYGGDSP